MPFVLWAYLFRRTRKRHTRYLKLKKKIESLTGEKIEPENSEKTKKFTFPWWFKIVLYSISFTCMLISIVLTIIKGYFLRI